MQWLLILVSLLLACKGETDSEWRKYYKTCVVADEPCFKNYVYNSTNIQNANRMRVQWDLHTPSNATLSTCEDRKKQFHAKYIVDLRCYWGFPMNPFHQLYDCFSANIPLLLATLELPLNETYLIVPGGKSEYYSAFLPTEWEHRYLPDHACIVGNRDLTAIYTICADYPSTKRFSREFTAQFKRNVRKMREVVFKKFGVQPSPKHVILIERGGSRTFDASVKQFMSFQFNRTLPHLPLVSYYGNESMADTVRLFSTAQAIIGFHGAGIGNVLFAPDNIVLVEISLYLNASAIGKSSQSPSLFLWRSDRTKTSIIDYAPIIVEYLQYGIAGSNIPQLANVTDLDRYLHGKIKDIVIPETDLRNMVEMVTRTVRFIRKEEAIFD